MRRYLAGGELEHHQQQHEQQRKKTQFDRESVVVFDIDVKGEKQLARNS